MENNQHNIKDAVLRKIRAHELTMRPRLYFTLQVVALLATGFAALAVSVFICNFILFSIRLNSHDVLLGWGPRGILAFLYFFPWGLLALDAALIFILERLLKQFRFGYSRPSLHLFLGLLVFVALVSFGIDRGTDVNDRLMRNADDNPSSSPFTELYTQARRPLPPGSGFARGVIAAIEGNTVTLKNLEGTTSVSVVLPPNDPRATTTDLQVGDTVFVAGDLLQNGAIQAFGVHKVSSNRPVHQRLILVK